MSDHLEDEIEHCNINPICFYNSFSVKIEDIFPSESKLAELVKLEKNAKMQKSTEKKFMNEKNNLSTVIENPQKKIKMEYH